MLKTLWQKIKRRCDKQNQERFRYSLTNRNRQLESLEPRQMLAADLMLTDFELMHVNKTLFNGGPYEQEKMDTIPVHFSPEKIGLAQQQGQIGFYITGDDGSVLEPSLLELRSDRDGDLFHPSYQQQSDHQIKIAGDHVVNHVAIFGLQAGDYRLYINQEQISVGGYQVETFLPGDANGDQQITNEDLDILRGYFGAEAGDAHYNIAIDSNYDGKITNVDGALWQETFQQNLLSLSRTEQTLKNSLQGSSEEEIEPKLVTLTPVNSYAVETNPGELDDWGAFMLSRGEENTEEDLLLTLLIDAWEEEGDEDPEVNLAEHGTDYQIYINGQVAEPDWDIGLDRYILDVVIPEDKSSTLIEIVPINNNTSNADRVVRMKIYDEGGEATGGGTIYLGDYIVEVGESDRAELTLFDSDGYADLQNRNVDTESTGQVEQTISNGTVDVSLEEGHLYLSLPIRLEEKAPSYRSDDNLEALFPVKVQFPPGTSAANIKAQVTLGNIKGNLETISVPAGADLNDPVYVVIQGPTTITERLRTGHYQYSIEFQFTVDGNPRTKTINASTEIINRVSEILGNTTFGRKWWIDQLDEIYYTDQVGTVVETGNDQDATQYGTAGLRTRSGIALIRGDNTSAVYYRKEYREEDIEEELAPTIHGGHLSTNPQNGNWKDGTGDGSYQYTSSDDTDVYAEWEFGEAGADLINDHVYQLFVNYTPGRERTSKAKYSIEKGVEVHTGQGEGSSVVTRFVDQRLVPGETEVRGTTWRSLGFFKPQDGNIKLKVQKDDESSSSLLIAGQAMLVKGWTFDQEASPDGSLGTSLAYDMQTGNFDLTTKYKNIYRFDADGKLDQSADRHKNITDYIYYETGSDAGKLKEIVDIHGLSWKYYYQASGYNINYYAGRHTYFDLNPNRQLIKVTEPDPDLYGLVDVIQEYAADYQDQPSPVHHFSYGNDFGLLSRVTSPRGDHTDIYYDDDLIPPPGKPMTGRVRKVVNPDAPGQQAAGSAAGHGGFWELTSFYHDALNTFRIPASGNMAGAVGEADLWREAQAKYIDPRAETEADEDHHHTWFYQVDAFGLETAMLDPEVNLWQSKRNSDGLVVQKIEPAGSGGGAGLPALLTLYRYDQHGNQTNVYYPQIKEEVEINELPAELPDNGGKGRQYITPAWDSSQLDDETLLSYFISESWLYDAEFSQQIEHIDGRGFKTESNLNTFGDIKEVREQVTSGGDPQWLSTKFDHTYVDRDFDNPKHGEIPGGLVTETIDPRGIVSTTEYFDNSSVPRFNGLVRKIVSGQAGEGGGYSIDSAGRTTWNGIVIQTSTQYFGYNTARNPKHFHKYWKVLFPIVLQPIFMISLIDWSLKFYQRLQMRTFKMRLL